MSSSDDDNTQWRRDYDQRQFRRMLERVKAFEAGTLHMADLQGNLTTLLTVLEEEPDERWADEYTVLCNELDVIWSTAVVRNNMMLTKEDVRRSHEIAARLKEIVLPKIHRDADGEGDS